MRINRKLVVSLGLVWTVSAPSAFAAGKDATVCETCNAKRTTSVQSQTKTLDELNKAINCSHAVQSKGECVKDFACNLGRSATTLATLGVNHWISNALQAAEEDNKKSNSCGDFRRNDCVAEVAATFIKDVWWNAEGIGIMGKFLAWDAPIATAKGTVKGLKWAGNKVLDWYDNPSLELKKLEDKASNFGRFIKGLNKEKIASYYKNSAKFVKEMAAMLYDTIDKFIADNFSCEEWTGAPHVSKCKRSWEGLACADCNTRINRVCAVGTLIVTESALMGVAWTKGGKLIAKGATLAKDGAVLVKSTAGYNKLADILGLPRKALAKAADKFSETTGIGSGGKKYAAAAAKDVKGKSAKAAEVKGPKAVKSEGKATTTAAATTDSKTSEAAAATKQEEYAKAIKEKPINFAEIDTTYIDNKIRQGVETDFPFYHKELKKYFIEDRAFEALPKSKQDDLITHWLYQMEKKGKTPADVNAEITKILNSCGIKTL